MHSLIASNHALPHCIKSCIPSLHQSMHSLIASKHALCSLHVLNLPGIRQDVRSYTVHVTNFGHQFLHNINIWLLSHTHAHIHTHTHACAGPMSATRSQQDPRASVDAMLPPSMQPERSGTLQQLSRSVDVGRVGLDVPVCRGAMLGTACAQGFESNEPYY